jgi:hypothetical protein
MSKKKRKHHRRSGGAAGSGAPRAPIYRAPQSAGPQKRTNRKAWIVAAVVVLVGIAAFAKFGLKGSSTAANVPTATPATAASPGAIIPPALTPAPAPVTGPRAQFATTTYDFGKANGDDFVDCRFTYTNTGIATLEFSEVSPACGCMKIQDWTRKVEPGQSGTLDVRYDSHHYTGPFAKSVFVTCNDPANPKPILEIKGYVFRPIEISPFSAAITLTAETPSNAASVKIISHVDEPLILSPPISSNPALLPELRTNQPGKEYQLVVSSPAPMPTGFVRGSVTMKTSLTNMPVLSIDAFANVLPLVSAIPNMIRLPAPPFTNAVPYNMWIRNNSTNPLAISEPSVNAKGVEVQIKEEQPGTQFGLILTFPAGFEAKASEPVELSVKCNHPKFPLLKVPVMQAPRTTVNVSAHPR